MKTWAFLLFLPFTLLACSYPLSELGLYKTTPLLKNTGLAAFADQDLNFELLQNTALASCLECHTSGSHSMNTPEKLLAQKTEILSTVHRGVMPPKSSGFAPVSACEQQMLETWLEDRTHGRATAIKVKDLSACADSEAPKQKEATDFASLPLSFENLKTEILAPKCLSCHASDSPGYQYALDDLSRIKANDLVGPSADESILFQVVVAGRTRTFMPPEKSGFKSLTAPEIDYLKRWIESGAPL